jgi:hypothetical protein
MVGVLRGWKIVELPAKGQIFNVSKLVLPVPMPADDDRQVPMFPDDAIRDLLLLAREQARALHEASVVTRELLQNARDARNGHSKRKPDDEPSKKDYVPQRKELRSYASGRAYFQQLEREVREDLRLKDSDAITPEMLYEAGAPHPKTTDRIMTLTYHLRREQWPPSTWPEEPHEV